MANTFPVSRPARFSLTSRSSASSAIEGFQPGGRIVGVNKGQFSLLDLIDAVLVITGPAQRLVVSTWTPGRSEMERVCRMLENHDVARFSLLVDRSFPTRHPEYVSRVTAICSDAEIRMTRTHAKFALVAAQDWRVTIRTSMNFNTNPRLEQFDLDDDAQIYDWFEGLIETLFAAIPEGLTAKASAVERAFGSVLQEPSRDGRATLGELLRGARA